MSANPPRTSGHKPERRVVSRGRRKRPWAWMLIVLCALIVALILWWIF